MEIISREQIIKEERESKDPIYLEILERETNHKHLIEKDSSGTYRWVADPVVNAMLETVSLNDVIIGFHRMGITKNHELYRKMYRDMGYSLNGYWEIFYWEANNEEADKYEPRDTSYLYGEQYGKVKEK